VSLYIFHAQYTQKCCASNCLQVEVYQHSLDTFLTDIPGTHTVRQIWKSGALESAHLMRETLLFFIMHNLLWASLKVFFIANKGQEIPLVGIHNHDFEWRSK
jgi:hypothetical protein